MTIRIFNTLSRRKEPFIPLEPGKVKMYVCGPTVYDDPHLGHARSSVVFDVIRRYLGIRGYQVTLVRNITDIDDKILLKAGRQGQDFRALSTRYLRRYQEAMRRLNVQAPDAEPRATEFVAPIQALISKLIQAGHAYTGGGNVCFAAASFNHYGRLSGRPLPTGAVDANACDKNGKRHPADFALWKAAKPGEPFWPSPWGPGRPGWHVECSAMSAELLGPIFDIHGGGTDLIFPHHENEIAQSAAIFGKAPANYWIHNGLVHVNGQKMSKSLGNGLKLNDLLDAHSPEALRLLLLTKCYRHPLEFSAEAMAVASRNATRLQRLFSHPDLPTVGPKDIMNCHGSLWQKVCRAMDNDFNFPMALSAIFNSVRTLNRQLGNTPHSRFLKPPDDPMATITELAFVCREIFGFKFDPTVAVAAEPRLKVNAGLAV